MAKACGISHFWPCCTLKFEGRVTRKIVYEIFVISKSQEFFERFLRDFWGFFDEFLRDFLRFLRDF